MARPERLRGRVVLLTGAASGIGRATALALADAGARLVLVDVGATALGDVAREAARVPGSDPLAVVASVTDREGMADAVRQGVDRFGGIDIVFANAGIACDPPTTIRRMDPTTFERVLEVDLLGVTRTVQAGLEQVVARGGYVLVTSSIYAFVNGMCNAPYAVAKAGVEMFARSLRAELAGSGAKAGVLYPGWVQTPIARSALGGHETASALVKLGFPAPMRQAIQPEAVAAAVVRGMGHRRSRIVVPARWAPTAALRGIVNPLTDLMIDHHRGMHRLLRRLESE